MSLKANIHAAFNESNRLRVQNENLRGELEYVQQRLGGGFGNLPKDVDTRIKKALASTVDSRAWTQDVPTQDGWYWHWNGDVDSAPFIFNILGEGGMTGKLFITMGNSGFENGPVDCDVYGGWWMRIPQPDQPKVD